MILFIKEYIKKIEVISVTNQTGRRGGIRGRRRRHSQSSGRGGAGAVAAGLLAGVGEGESGLVVAAASPWASPFSATICRCWFLREEEKR